MGYITGLFTHARMPICCIQPQGPAVYTVNMSAKEGGVEYTLGTLVHAIQWGDLNHVENAVEKFGFSVDSVDVDGCSLLHWAAINNRLDIARYLVNKGANSHVTGGNNNENPLQWCVRSSNCLALLTLFLNEGVSMTHKSIYGCDTLMIAVQCEQLNAVLALLHAGADVNTVEINGDTPLYWLLRKYSSAPTLEFIEMQRLLHRFNASVTHRANDGCNALHIIAGAGARLDLGSALLVYRAGDDAMLEAKNANNLTPHEVTGSNQQLERLLCKAAL
jgi:ankyrin repeat protein